jgi:hypothetical protein
VAYIYSLTHARTHAKIVIANARTQAREQTHECARTNSTVTAILQRTERCLNPIRSHCDASDHIAARTRCQYHNQALKKATAPQAFKKATARCSLGGPPRRRCAASNSDSDVPRTFPGPFFLLPNRQFPSERYREEIIVWRRSSGTRFSSRMDSETIRRIGIVHRLFRNRPLSLHLPPAAAPDPTPRLPQRASLGRAH